MIRIRQIFAFLTFALVAAMAALFVSLNAGKEAASGNSGFENSGASRTIDYSANSFGFSSEMARLSLKEPDARLLMPVKGVRVRQIADTWGAPREGGRSHSGQDIFARRGTPVFSATEGYVLRVGESNLGGKTVFVAGAGGRRYYYAHLDNFAPDLKAGDFVTADTLIGYVGSTGNARNTPPHLHFGVYAPGAGAMNPLPLLNDRI